MSLTKNLSILWLNVNGLEKTGNPGSGLGSLLDLFKTSQYDIICLQETHYNLRNYSLPYNYELICKNRGYPAWFTHSVEASEGVAVIFKPHISPNDIGVVEVVPNRCQLIQINTGNSPLSFANSYAPSNNVNKIRSNYFKDLKKILPKGCIIGGDFNIVQDMDLDLLRPYTKSPYENGGWAECMEMQGHLQIEDGWRKQEGEDARVYTKKTMKHNTMSCQSRIDMVLTPKSTCPTPFPWITQ